MVNVNYKLEKVVGTETVAHGYVKSFTDILAIITKSWCWELLKNHNFKQYKIWTVVKSLVLIFTSSGQFWFFHNSGALYEFIVPLC